MTKNPAAPSVVPRPSSSSTGCGTAAGRGTASPTLGAGRYGCAVTLPGQGRAPGDPTFRGHCEHLDRVLAGILGDVVLVGHSYSGALLTEVGDAPNVRALIFVSAFRLEPGESVASVNDAEAGSEAGVDDIRLVGAYLVIGREAARPPSTATAHGRGGERCRAAYPRRVGTRAAVVRARPGGQSHRISSCAPWTGRVRRRSSA